MKTPPKPPKPNIDKQTLTTAGSVRCQFKPIFCDYPTPTVKPEAAPYSDILCCACTPSDAVCCLGEEQIV